MNGDETRNPNNSTAALMLLANDKIIKHKVELSNLTEGLGIVSKVSNLTGVSRDTFYRYQESVTDGKKCLFDRNRRT